MPSLNSCTDWSVVVRSRRSEGQRKPTVLKARALRALLNTRLTANVSLLSNDCRLTFSTLFETFNVRSRHSRQGTNLFLFYYPCSVNFRFRVRRNTAFRGVRVKWMNLIISGRAVWKHGEAEVALKANTVPGPTVKGSATTIFSSTLFCQHTYKSLLRIWS